MGLRSAPAGSQAGLFIASAKIFSVMGSLITAGEPVEAGRMGCAFDKVNKKGYIFRYAGVKRQPDCYSRRPNLTETFYGSGYN